MANLSKMDLAKVEIGGRTIELPRKLYKSTDLFTFENYISQGKILMRPLEFYRDAFEAGQGYGDDKEGISEYVARGLVNNDTTAFARTQKRLGITIDADPNTVYIDNVRRTNSASGVFIYCTSLKITQKSLDRFSNLFGNSLILEISDVPLFLELLLNSCRKSLFHYQRNGYFDAKPVRYLRKPTDALGDTEVDPVFDKDIAFRDEHEYRFTWQPAQKLIGKIDRLAADDPEIGKLFKIVRKF